jgi:hypothetical protein
MSGIAMPAVTLWLGASALPRDALAAAGPKAAARPEAPAVPPLPAPEALRAGCGNGCCAQPASNALLPRSAAAEPEAAAPAWPTRGPTECINGKLLNPMLLLPKQAIHYTSSCTRLT